MLYIQLFIVFFKIGLFSFGGGIAMLPIIQKEVVGHSWLTVADFMKIISISQVTPGPIAVNTSTFVGLKAGGILGGGSGNNSSKPSICYRHDSYIFIPYEGSKSSYKDKYFSGNKISKYCPYRICSI